MKRFIFAAVVAPSTAPALAANVGVSVSVGQPVYFVPENWYNGVYVKGYGKGHDKDHGKGQQKV